MPDNDIHDGLRATLDEMSYPDWARRLQQAQRESKEGKGITLDEYIERRRARR